MGVEIKNQGRKRIGLGDAVEVVARPIAKAIGKDPDCLPCKKRKQRLNHVGDVVVNKLRLFGGRRAR